MIPKNGMALHGGLETVRQPGRTYRLNAGEERLQGFADGLEAVRQAVFLVLNVERYRYLIYSWNYGVELEDLMGKPVSFVLPELKRRIAEALLQDDRIQRADGFEFQVRRNKILCEFTVHSRYGDFSMEKEVPLNA